MEFDPERFYVFFPVFILTDEPSGKTPVALWVKDGDEGWVMMFTDKAGAVDMVVALNRNGSNYRVIELNDKETHDDLIRVCEADGATHVRYDPIPGRDNTGSSQPIGNVLNATEKQHESE